MPAAASAPGKAPAIVDNRYVAGDVLRRIAIRFY